MMDILEKPARRWICTVLKYILVVALTMWGIILSVVCTQESTRYATVREKAVTVTATIVEIRESWDPEEGSEYDAYIGYSYQGKYYEDLYKTYGTRSKANSMIGKQVQIEINPDSPWERVTDVRTNAIFSCVFSGLLLASGLACLCIREREKHTVAFGWYSAMIEKDVQRSAMRGVALWLWPTVVGLVYMGLYLTTGDALSIVMLIIGIVLLIIGAALFWSWHGDFKLIRDGKYRTSTDTLVDKRIEKDSDGNVYVLVYSNGVNQWTENTNLKKYNKTQLGQQLQTVYLEGHKRPYIQK